jgi:hypothetical protein
LVFETKVKESDRKKKMAMSFSLVLIAFLFFTGIACIIYGRRKRANEETIKAIAFMVIGFVMIGILVFLIMVIVAIVHV